jgi:hypothetical protein
MLHAFTLDIETCLYPWIQQYHFLKIVPTAKNWQHTAPKLKPMSQSQEFRFPKKWQRIL